MKRHFDDSVFAKPMYKYALLWFSGDILYKPIQSKDKWGLAFNHKKFFKCHLCHKTFVYKG